MGVRSRVKARVDLWACAGPATVVPSALRKYSPIAAANSSTWFTSGASHASFADDQLGQLKQVPGDAFEVVQAGTIVKP